MSVSSPQNSLLKKVRQSAESGRAMDNGCVIAEGPHLVGEALQSPWAVRQVLATPESMARFPELMAAISKNSDVEFTEVTQRAFQSVAATGHSQGMLALVEPPVWKWRDLLERGTPLIVLDGIQDPGNAGTIVRSAEAFDAAGVVFCVGSVRVANTKLLRAAAGSIFRLPFLEGVSVVEVIKEIRQSGARLYALAGNRDTSLLTQPLHGRIAFVVGSEGAGVGPEFMAAARPLSIPTVRVESLNAAVACSIALFEAARRRGETFQKTP